MPTDLPTTAIGLIAFVIVACGICIWRVIVVFMTYIEKKNGNLERATKLFTEAMEAQELRHRDTLIKQNEQHKEMMEDYAGRLENLIPKNPKV